MTEKNTTHNRCTVQKYARLIRLRLTDFSRPWCAVFPVWMDHTPCQQGVCQMCPFQSVGTRMACLACTLGVLGRTRKMEAVCVCVCCVSTYEGVNVGETSSQLVHMCILTLMASHSGPPLVNTKHCHTSSFLARPGYWRFAMNRLPSPLTLSSNSSYSERSIVPTSNQDGCNWRLALCFWTVL